MSKTSSEILDNPKEGGKKKKKIENDGGDSSLLIPQLDRDLSIHCLLRLSRSEYGLIAALNQSFRSLIKDGELYQHRRKMGIIEHWVYFRCEDGRCENGLCDAVKWEAFDPNRGRLMQLPELSSDICFLHSDKESLAVATELLVFGRELTSFSIYKYNFPINSWSKGMKMNTPRCVFGSASLGEKAILVGGCDQHGNILSSSELYNSDTGTWEILPDMNTARRTCSAVFMDGKFYVLGGVGVDNTTRLTCGEEFDLETKMWRKIPKMCPPQDGEDGANETPVSGAPPLIAVVNNVLFAADYAQKIVKRYVKDKNSWVTIGSLPDRVTSVNGWGIGFRSCGDKLVVIGGPSARGRMETEVNAWVVDEGAPKWNTLAIIQSGSFVHNCVVMGC